MLDESICHFRDVESNFVAFSIFDGKSCWQIHVLYTLIRCHNVAPDLGLHCLPMTLGKNGLKQPESKCQRWCDNKTSS